MISSGHWIYLLQSGIEWNENVDTKYSLVGWHLREKMLDTGKTKTLEIIFYGYDNTEEYY